MSVVGTLSVKITGDAKELDKTLKTSLDRVEKFGTAAAAAAATVAAAFAAMSKMSIDNMDNLYKMSQMAGVTTESLSALGYAAKLSGVSQDQLTQSLVRLSKGMSDAAQGTGEALGAFQALKIDPAKFATTDEALLALAERFAGLEDGTNKTALAIALFGRSGAQLIPFLNAGRDGIEALKDEARKLGVVFNDEAAKAAEKFNDDLERLKTQLEGVVISITNKMLPALNQFVTGINNIKDTNFKGWLFSDPQEERNAKETIEELSQRLEGLQKTRKEFIDFNDRFTWLAWYNADDVALIDKQIALITAKIEYLKKALVTIPQDTINWDTDNIVIDEPRKKPAPKLAGTKTAGVVSEYDKALQNLTEQIALVGKLTEAEKMLAMIESGRYGQLTANQQKNLMNLATTLDTTRQIQEASIAYENFIAEITGRTEADTFIEQMGMLADALYRGKINAEQYEQAIEKLVKKFKDNTDDMGEFAKEAARKIQDTLGNTLEQVLSGNFKNIGDSFAQMLRRMVAQLAASQLNKLLFGDFDKSGEIGGLASALTGIGKAVAGSFAGSFAGSLGGGAVATPVNLSSSITANPLSSGGYTGDGGKYQPAGVVHKGEYVLNKEATTRLGVANLDRLNKGYANGGYVGSGTGGNVNINIKNEAGADGYQASAVAKRNESGLDIDIIVKRAVASDLRNNGGIAQQFASTFGLRRTA